MGMTVDIFHHKHSPCSVVAIGPGVRPISKQARSGPSGLHANQEREMVPNALNVFPAAGLRSRLPSRFGCGIVGSAVTASLAFGWTLLPPWRTENPLPKFR
jgi:hypothetical protein